MKRLIDKSALVAEIERRMKLRQDGYRKYNDVNNFVAFEELEYLHDEFLPTLEVKDANEALRTEYEKGRADVIAEIEKCYEKAITAEAQTYLIKDLLDRLKTKK